MTQIRNRGKVSGRKEGIKIKIQVEMPTGHPHPRKKVGVLATAAGIILESTMCWW